MWCRAILATTAITCTFVTAVHAHGQPQIKDIVCLLVLNGLQKDDLDVNTLKKLQRHNVNIDDLNNENLRKECVTTSGISSTLQSNEDKPPDLRNKKTKSKLSDSNLQNIIINYFNNAQKSNQPNDSETIRTSEPKLSTELPDVKNFLNLWNKFIKTRRGDIVATTTEEVKPTDSETTMKRKIQSHDSSMEYINNVIENLIARKKITTTDSPTTESVDYHQLARKIQELLLILAETRKQNAPSQTITSTAVEDKYVTERVNEITQNNNPLKTFGPVKPIKPNMESNASYQAMKTLVDDGLRQINIAEGQNSKHIKQINDQQIKSLSDVIVKEISETVKAKVLQDLRNEIITSTLKPKEHSTAKSSTSTVKQAGRSSIIVIPNQEKVNTTNMLETIMEMFQQFKAKEFTSTTNKTLPHNKLKTDFLQNSFKFAPQYITPSSNIYQIEAHAITMSPVVLNPYIPQAPNLQTGILPNPYSLLHINTPIHGANGAKPVHKITQLNIFNTRNNYHTPPQTIQTNSVEIHPLGLPGQQSFVYQNIVVTTKNPFERFKNLPLATHDKYGNNDKHKDRLPSHALTGALYKDLSFGGQARSRESKDDEYYRDSRHKQNRYRDYGRIPYNHNRERFHEKLERINEWPQISRENRDEDNSTPKLVTRHQIPLNDAKKRPRFDDEHFKKFLKTQQKVNDMLERILATKTIDNQNRARSVEIDF